MIVVEKIAVLGAGIMGAGIAQVASQGGYQVIVTDTDTIYIERGLDVIRKSLAVSQERGKLNSKDTNGILARIKGTVRMEEAVEDAHLIIEAVPEKLELKRQLFAKIDKLCPKSTILATNTSSLNITTIAAATQRPEKVIGMHFSNPVPEMMGVELI